MKTIYALICVISVLLAVNKFTAGQLIAPGYHDFSNAHSYEPKSKGLMAYECNEKVGQLLMKLQPANTV